MRSNRTPVEGRVPGAARWSRGIGRTSGDEPYALDPGLHTR